MQQLFNPLLEISKATSCFETERNYISLSNMMRPVSELISDYNNGYTADDNALLKCRMGYYMERGMKERLLQIEGVEDSYEIEVPGSKGLIKGHPDFKFNGMPGDCKSYCLDEHLPDERKIPKKIYWQMNAYMLYTVKPTAVLVCESRESGRFKTITVYKNPAICDSIRLKVDEIMKYFELNPPRKAIAVRPTAPDHVPSRY